ncbi:hypothetical protein Nepgr_030116 [Nepenthes gracilis]|uniref:Uncharacterized protein n=1 Tax=Nepenthes gracilis TaxID=150966 RepID=A0AAD3Y3W6_NEPGR|nr:hypothetical protein Nepgr_030116 [Nepenthes gracilis]
MSLYKTCHDDNGMDSMWTYRNAPSCRSLELSHGVGFLKRMGEDITIPCFAGYGCLTSCEVLISKLLAALDSINSVEMLREVLVDTNQSVGSSVEIPSSPLGSSVNLNGWVGKVVPLCHRKAFGVILGGAIDENVEVMLLRGLKNLPLLK